MHVLVIAVVHAKVDNLSYVHGSIGMNRVG